MSISEKQFARKRELQHIQDEYFKRLESIRCLQKDLEAQQRALFEFISENQDDFNKLYG